jgi:hypothetical protein
LETYGADKGGPNLSIFAVFIKLDRYVFSKYLPIFNEYVGTSKELSNYIKVQSDQLEADVKKK